MNLFSEKNYFILILLILVVGALFIAIKINPPQQNSTNKKILQEIDSLLPLMENKSITSSDFNQIASQVGQDDYAQGEIVELKALADDKEYTHIGHGLGFLYQYIKTGVAPVCPGHSLSHYYVFIKHNQTDLAENNLNDSENEFGIWSNDLILRNNTNMTDMNEFSSLYHSAILQIESGNSTASDDEISYFSDAICT